jgi:hypothetical protein
MRAKTLEDAKVRAGFMLGIQLCKSAIEFVRRDGYNDIDYVLEVIEKKCEKLRVRP